MKGKPLILIFLFLIFIVPSVAETDQYHIEYASDFDFTKAGSTPNNYDKGINSIYVPDISTIGGASFMQVDLKGSWLGSTENSDYAKCNLYSDAAGTNHIGTGIIGFIKGYDDKYRVQLFIDGELDWGVLSGAQFIHWSLKTGETLGAMSYQQAETTSGAGNQQIHFTHHTTGAYRYLSGGSVHTVKMIYEFTNEIEYFYNSTEQYFDYTIYRNASNPSKLYINNSNITLRNESAFQTTNWSTYNHDTEYPIWTTWVTTDNDDIVQLEINWSALMGDGPATEGTITLSQTTYVKPDPVLAHIDLENEDYVQYRYYAVIQSYNGSAWVDLTNWERISSVWESSKVWEYTWTDENLPLTIRGAIYEYDLNTETYDMISYSESSTYVEPPPDTTGSISTDQTVYDVGDTVTVNYTTADPAFVIAQKWPTAVWNQGEYYIWEVTAGSGTRTFVIPPSGTGEWRVRLSANNQEVDTVFFTVNDTTTVYLAWHDIDGILGETQAVHFYSDDVAATLKIYDADQTVIYDETVGDGYFPNYAISTQTNQAPGTWTASLNNSGSYYNDTLLMYAKDAYVAFNADSYILDQTITVNYYLKRSTQTIVLYDSNKKDVITWTTTGNYIHLGTGSVDFTLSDDNEYGLDIVAGVDANDIKLGLWKVEVLDRGQPIIDNPVYDSAKVSRSADDPADVSNEMISIFFSPEGVFMLYTVCLTMLGLVLAKHPAGGGAGATVGIGFGVYFNVLPPWMLMLTVILLVVLGGVSVAAYYRGK